MKIGFIGTGKIGSAVIRGYCESIKKKEENGPLIEHVIISKRSEEKSTRLKLAYTEYITVCEENQTIVDQSNIIFIGLLPAIARQELSKLKFQSPSSQRIVSMMATIPYEELLDLIKYKTTDDVHHPNVLRIVPLPTAAQNIGPILAYPAKMRSNFDDILQLIGDGIYLETEKDMMAMTSLTSMISHFYATCDILFTSCVDNGINDTIAKNYISLFFSSMSNFALQSNETFHDLRIEAATGGGLNEQVFNNLNELNTYENLRNQYIQILQRLASTKKS